MDVYCCVVKFLNELINVYLQITKLKNYQTSLCPLNYPNLSPASSTWQNARPPSDFPLLAHTASRDILRAPVSFSVHFGHQPPISMKKERQLKKVSISVTQLPKQSKVAEASRNSQKLPSSFHMHLTTQRVEVEFMPSFELLTK